MLAGNRYSNNRPRRVPLPGFRAYARKSFLEPTQDHAAILDALFGCDILNYRCHLSIINQLGYQRSN